MSEPTALYRHFDSAGALLYVGISLNALLRLSQHKTAPWFREIARVEIEWHDTREAAISAESAAIRDEGPRWNKAGAFDPEFRAFLVKHNLLDKVDGKGMLLPRPPMTDEEINELADRL